MDISVLTSHPLVQRVEQYYLRLAPRDQLAVRVLSVFASLVLVYLLIIQPAASYFEASKTHYISSLESFRWMEQHKSQVQSNATNQAARDSGQSLLGIANSTSKGYQLSFRRYEPVGDDGLSLWLDNVGFNNMVLWLERLDKRYGIRVKEISVEGQSQQGMVNVRLVLQG